MCVDGDKIKIYRNKKGNEGENMLKVGLPNVRFNHNNSNIQKKAETKIYHPSQDTVRKKLMIDLNKIENERKIDIKKIEDKDVVRVKSNESHLNRDFDRNFDRNCDNSFNNNLVLDGYKYSYARLSYLYRTNKLTKERLLDLKAQKQGFKNHYERVLMRYMEVVKSYKFKTVDGSFKDAKEKHRIFKQMKSMEGFLRQKEIEKEAELNGSSELSHNRNMLHVPMSAVEGCC
jgi:uncharacterized protein YifE (UPF0438 family)